MAWFSHKLTVCFLCIFCNENHNRESGKDTQQGTLGKLRSQEALSYGIGFIDPRKDWIGGWRRKTLRDLPRENVPATMYKDEPE